METIRVLNTHPQFVLIFVYEGLDSHIGEVDPPIFRIFVDGGWSYL